MSKVNLKASALALALATASLGLAGCEGGKNESYTGVPTKGSCEDFYQKPANVAACVRAQSQH